MYHVVENILIVWSVFLIFIYTVNSSLLFSVRPRFYVEN
jgi:hypothetical protein